MSKISSMLDVIISDEQQLKQLEALHFTNSSPEALTKALSYQGSIKATLKLLT